MLVAALLGALSASWAANESPAEAAILREVPADPSLWRAIAADRALTAAARIDEPYRRAQMLAAIARAQTLVPGAPVDRTIQDALAAAGQVGGAEFQAWALHEIALAQIAAEDFTEARDTARRIQPGRRAAGRRLGME